MSYPTIEELQFKVETLKLIEELTRERRQTLEREVQVRLNQAEAERIKREA